MPILFLVLFLLFMGCSTTRRNIRSADFYPDYSAELPTVLDFSIKNGVGDALVVHYFYGKLFITEQIRSKVVAYNFEPAPEEWSAFWRSLKIAHVWEWGSSVDPGMPDFWLLHLSKGGYNISINGTHFERGLDGDLSTKKEGWIVFVSALQRLIQRDSKILRDTMKEV